MRLLFVLNDVPFPPTNGVRIVAFNAIRLMAGQGHDIYVSVLTQEPNAALRYEQLRQYIRIEKGFVCHLPKRNRLAVLASALLKNNLFAVERFKVRDFGERLRDFAEDIEPDTVHFDIITMLQYRKYFPQNIGSIASVNDSYALTLENSLKHGAYRGAKKLLRYWQFLQARKYEKNVYLRFSTVHVMTDVDARYLKKLCTDVSVTVIPNGVDDSLFAADNGCHGRTSIVFVASLAGDNLFYLEQFLKSGWPLVLRSIFLMQS